VELSKRSTRCWRRVTSRATPSTKQIVVRVIELSRSRFSRSLGTASKLNRDPRFIEDLMAHGEARAEEFLAALAFENAWRSRDPDAVMGFFAEDAEIASSAPFPSRGTHRGEQEIRRFVAEHLAGETSAWISQKSRSRETESPGRLGRSVTRVPPTGWRASRRRSSGREDKGSPPGRRDAAGVSNETSVLP
jgi:hypothetical protein